MKAREQEQAESRTLIPSIEFENNQRDINYIAIHCAATKPSMTVPIERVREWHLKRGFNDVGYHIYIRQNGSVEFGRPLSVAGAHVKNYNSVSIGICYEGGIDEFGEAFDTRTDAQKNTLERIVKELNAEYPHAAIQGHRDFPNVSKACPSFDVKEWIKTIGL